MEYIQPKTHTAWTIRHSEVSKQSAVVWPTYMGSANNQLIEREQITYELLGLRASKINQMPIRETTTDVYLWSSIVQYHTIAKGA